MKDKERPKKGKKEHTPSFSPETELYPAHGVSLDEGQTFITMKTLEQLAAKEKKERKK